MGVIQQQDFSLLGKSGRVYVTQEMVQPKGCDENSLTYLFGQIHPAFVPRFLIWVFEDEHGVITTGIFKLATDFDIERDCLAVAEGVHVKHAQRLCVDAEEGDLEYDEIFVFYEDWERSMNER
jgi:hypothetical protein